MVNGARFVRRACVTMAPLLLLLPACAPKTPPQHPTDAGATGAGGGATGTGTGGSIGSTGAGGGAGATGTGAGAGATSMGGDAGPSSTGGGGRRGRGWAGSPGKLVDRIYRQLRECSLPRRLAPLAASVARLT